MFSVPPHKTTSASLTQISYLKTNEQQNLFIMTEVRIKKYVLSSKLIVNLITNLSYLKKNPFHSVNSFYYLYFSEKKKITGLQRPNV